jgi:hypothetical protein
MVEKSDIHLTLLTEHFFRRDDIVPDLVRARIRRSPRESESNPDCHRPALVLYYLTRFPKPTAGPSLGFASPRARSQPDPPYFHP